MQNQGDVQQSRRFYWSGTQVKKNKEILSNWHRRKCELKPDPFLSK
jgi:hypothetical protein